MSEPDTPRRIDAASAMIKQQLIDRGITDKRVIDAMWAIPRDRFVALSHRDAAYSDAPVRIGCGQTISQPYMVAIMTQLLELKPEDRVLEIGTGSGYQTAILATLAREVVSIERHPELSANARKNLDAVGITNVTLLVGDGSLGDPAHAPYDAILVTAGAPSVPRALKDQLAEGGRLICPTGTRDEQRLIRIVRKGGTLFHEKGLPCVFVPLIGKEGWNN